QRLDITDPSNPKPVPTPAPKPPGPPGPRPEKPKPAAPPNPASPAAKFYQPKTGFANFYFNKQESDRLLAAFRKHGDFSKLTGDRSSNGEARLKELKTEGKPVKGKIAEEKSPEGKSTTTVVRLSIGNIDYKLDPLKDNQTHAELVEPTGSGGLLLSLYL